MAGTPVFVYDRARLEAQAITMLKFPAPYGLTVRYAMKALPTSAVLRIFARLGLGIDASSGGEVHRALAAGLKPESISLSTQELPSDFAELRRLGVAINACSLRQLGLYGVAFPGTEVGLRFNPGAGSGSTNRTNVGGPSSSFGIWHEKLSQVFEILERYQLRPVRIHTHIGSGGDPAVWKKVARMTLTLAKNFPDVGCVNLGGGFKVARMPGESFACIEDIGSSVAQALEEFAAETGRRLHLEIEPGTFLTANCGALLSKVQDVVDTGQTGCRFAKLDAGMTEILRPSLYGAQHPISLLPPPGEEPRQEGEWVVVGHCCESGDLLTPAPGDPELLQPRRLPELRVGDLVVVGGAGAYCSSMCTKHYNSFPEAPEVLLDLDGQPKIIRKKQPLTDLWRHETDWHPQSA